MLWKKCLHFEEIYIYTFGEKITFCENIYLFGGNIYTFGGNVFLNIWRKNLHFVKISIHLGKTSIVCGNVYTFGRNIYYPLYNDISKQQVAVDSYPIEITVENVANSEFISLFLYQPECVLYLCNGIVIEFQCLL